MANEMMVIQHGCEGLLRFIIPDDTVTIDMKIMILKGIQDKNSSEKPLSPGVKTISLPHPS